MSTALVTQVCQPDQRNALYFGLDKCIISKSRGLRMVKSLASFRCAPKARSTSYSLAEISTR
jgi:hypothetical protein